MLAVFNPDAPQAMAIIKQNGGMVWETFQPPQSPIGSWLADPTLDTQMLLDRLMKALPSLTLLFGITQQDPDIVPRPKHEGGISTLDYIDTARITVTGSFEDYWEKRGRNLRQNLKKQRAQLEKQGVSTRLEILTTPEDVLEAVRDYGKLESSGWKGDNGTAVHEKNAQGRFYHTMLKRFCRMGKGRIYRYWYNEMIVAMDLCIVDNGTLIILKTAYDENIRNGTSPALLMRQEAFRRVFERDNIQRIEFYGKVMDWHTKWTDEIRTMYHINYYRWSVIPKLRNLRAATEAA